MVHLKGGRQQVSAVCALPPLCGGDALLRTLGYASLARLCCEVAHGAL